MTLEAIKNLYEENSTAYISEYTVTDDDEWVSAREVYILGYRNNEILVSDNKDGRYSYTVDITELYETEDEALNAD